MFSENVKEEKYPPPAVPTCWRKETTRGEWKKCASRSRRKASLLVAPSFSSSSSCSFGRRISLKEGGGLWEKWHDGVPGAISALASLPRCWTSSLLFRSPASQYQSTANVYWQIPQTQFRRSTSGSYSGTRARWSTEQQKFRRGFEKPSETSRTGSSRRGTSCQSQESGSTSFGQRSFSCQGTNVPRTKAGRGSFFVHDDCQTHWN